MTLLNAIDSFINEGAAPDKIIFDKINTQIEILKKRKIYKSGKDLDIRFEDLKSIAYENLLIKKNIKFLLKSLDDEKASSILYFLINQYYDKQNLDSNPELNRLNNDLKDLLTSLNFVFLLTGKSKLLNRKSISLTKDFNRDDFNDYKFSPYQARNSRLSEIFFQTIDILEMQKSISYTELLEILKKNLNISEISEVRYEYELTDNDDNYDDNSKDIDKQKSESYKIPDSNNIITSEESIHNVFNYFIKLLSERENVFFGIDLLKRFKSTDNLPDSIDLDEIKELLIKYYGIKKSVYYSEINSSNEKLLLSVNKYSLDDNQKLYLIRELSNYYLNRFEEFLKESKDGN